MTLSAVITGSALALLSGLTIFHAVYIEESEFKSPPAREEAPPPPPQLDKSVSQKQRQSARPVPRMTPNVQAMVQMPDITVPTANVDMKVAVGLGDGAGRAGGSFGSASIDINSSPVNFFGLRESGERILFLIDAGEYMMDDKKGGLYAYRIVKEEVVEQISGLKPGTLFNVVLFQRWGKQLNLFKPSMVPATDANKKAVEEWFKPINEDPDRLGPRSNDYKLAKPLSELGEKSHGVYHALHAGFELGTDAIFVLAGGWSNSMRQPLPEDFNMEEWRKDQGWDAEDQAAWDAAVQRARDWLRRENAARRARGDPPRVNNHIPTIVRDMLNDDTPQPPYPPRESWNMEDLIAHFRELARVFYKKENFNDPIERPAVNVIIFRGKDEGWSERADAGVEEFVSRNKGRRRLLEGLEGVELATGRRAEERPEDLNNPDD